ncbi:hypothetical protein KEF85_13870 [Methylomonas paludis]|uniref:Uncharacterized protein n=1 Tax=Methylomonas paludis TaxID=1173101 RepID=A0A975MM48_9GAMM|nr:hypothetical protein [Methylomonas paludis]QWF70411.1 hypothetical protein KEF85_13870 [Methylomonas paludis]
MNTQLKKNRILIIVIFAMSIIPFLIAWYLAKNPAALRLGASNGDLITPPLPIAISEFSGYDPFSAEKINELQGHWVLVNLVPNNQCGPVCEDALYKSRQLSLMLGKDIPRIRRAAIVMAKNAQPVFSADWQTDGRLLKVEISSELSAKLQAIAGQSITEGMLFIMDPLGNLMMKYPVGYDPYKVRNDLSKLLKISQIG